MEISAYLWRTVRHAVSSPEPEYPLNCYSFRSRSPPSIISRSNKMRAATGRDGKAVDVRRGHSVYHDQYVVSPRHSIGRSQKLSIGLFAYGPKHSSKRQRKTTPYMS